MFCLEKQLEEEKSKHSEQDELVRLFVIQESIPKNVNEVLECNDIC